MLRKKWLSFLVAVSMVAAMLPTTAFADTVETTGPVEPQTSVTETAQDKKDPVEGGEQPEVVDNENTATGEGDKGAGQSDEDETVTEETEEETKEPETPADETEEKTEDVEEPASEEADTDEETVMAPPVTTPEVTETPVAGNNAVDTQNLTGGDEADDGIKTEEELREALAKEGTIKLAGDIQLTSMLNITTNNVTLDLDGHKITAAEWFAGNGGNDSHLVQVTADNVTIQNGQLVALANNKHVLNVYKTTDQVPNVTLENVELDHTAGKIGAPMIVAGSNVTLKGNVQFNTGGKSWYGVNVDSLENADASLKLSEGANVVFGGVQKVGICIDNSKDQKVTVDLTGGKVTVPEGGSTVKLNDGAEATVIGLQDAPEGAAANVDGVYYASFDEAWSHASDNSAVTLYGEVTLDSMLTINKPGVNFDLNGHTISASVDFVDPTPTGSQDATNNDNHLIDVTADGVTITNGTLKAGTLNNHTLNIWSADGVTLENVTLDGSAAGMGGAPLIVGASNVTLKGDIELKTGENSWYGMNVDSRKVSGTNKGASLTLDSAKVSVTGSNPIGIYVENTAGDDVDLNFNGEPVIMGQADGFVPVQFAVEKDTGAQDANATLNFNTTNGFDISDCGFGATLTVSDGDNLTTTGFNSFEDAFAYVNNNPDAVNPYIILYEDVQLDSKLVINTEGLTLDLNGKTISASDNFKKKGHLVEITADGVSIVNGTIQGNEYVDHALHVWNADNVKLGNGLVLDNAATTVGGAPLVIGASNVTLEGNTTFVTGEKSWYGANVDSSMVGDKKEGSSLTVEGKIVFVGENVYNAGIWVEDSKGGDPVKVTVSFEEGSSAQGNGVDGFRVIYIKKDNDNKPQGTVEGAENAGLITDEEGNYIVKPAPAPQPQQPAGSSSHKHNYTWQHSDDEHWQYCADCGQAISNGPHTLQWKDGYQECTVCGYRVGSSTAAAPAAQASAPAAAAPAAPAAPAAVAIPQTGDASNPMLWVVLLAVSGSALGALVYTKKKREE